MFRKFFNLFGIFKKKQFQLNEVKSQQSDKQNKENINLNTNKSKEKFENNWDNSFDEKFDWFADRYQSLTFQRNLTIFFLVFSIVGLIIVSIISISLFKNRTIEPFVIEIDKNTGFVNVVKDDQKMKIYTQDEILRNYFIKKYLEARETFDPRNYDYIYNNIIPAFSNQNTYRQFVYWIRSNDKNNPTILFQNNIECNLSIVSINPIPNDGIQVRFVVEAILSSGNTIKINKIATINYEFQPYDTNEERKYINPLGFIVTNYRSNEENIS